jgi:hypothetical protein
MGRFQSEPKENRLKVLDTPTTMRGAVNQCRDIFQTSLHKDYYLAITNYSKLINVIYNQLYVNIYQQHISSISHHHKEQK